METIGWAWLVGVTRLELASHALLTTSITHRSLDYFISMRITSFRICLYSLYTFTSISAWLSSSL